MPRSLNLTRADRIGYVAGGIALIVWALRRPSWSRAMAAGMGGWFLYQAYTGTNPMLQPLGIRVNREPARPELAETLVVEEAITISRPRTEVYAYFARPEHLPALADADVDIARNVAGEELAWRGLRGDKLVHFGSLSFREAPGARGTIVAAHLEHAPGGGSLGVALARVMGRSPQRLLADALRRARAILETGEAPSTSGQPSGRR
ncbi:MAG TPA: hypothetical protein VLI89_15495 [Burkholderiales bacterium]|nr:hypothetical protein [Burkholderiales bacterium]